jgi:hypothetical protein
VVEAVAEATEEAAVPQEEDEEDEEDVPAPTLPNAQPTTVGRMAAKATPVPTVAIQHPATNGVRLSST